jgi:hypothetical protein
VPQQSTVGHLGHQAAHPFHSSSQQAGLTAGTGHNTKAQQLGGLTPQHPFQPTSAGLPSHAAASISTAAAAAAAAASQWNLGTSQHLSTLQQGPAAAVAMRPTPLSSNPLPHVGAADGALGAQLPVIPSIPQLEQVDSMPPEKLRDIFWQLINYMKAKILPT